jgi:hypothetical protein
MRASEKTGEPGHLKRFQTHAKRSIAIPRLELIKANGKIKTRAWLKLMKTPFQRGAGSLEEYVPSGCRERIGKPSGLRMIEWLSSANPNDGRTKSRDARNGLKP